ncbi:hypothetical protein BQ8794_200018 [Mesorhizobium prunaredense]|uniref:Uncharacterized protein n=1 Tax=Mesorhizobium prunaredense TaxID=1631249 RepID=A0A1R3V528_9HYPH|nr:hypothetical protein BQ8794_200018 [Mesorhizobium prunaredense]
MTLSDVKRSLTWRLALPRKSFVNDDKRQGQPQSAGIPFEQPPAGPRQMGAVRYALISAVLIFHR